MGKYGRVEIERERERERKRERESERVRVRESESERATERKREESGATLPRAGLRHPPLRAWRGGVKHHVVRNKVGLSTSGSINKRTCVASGRHPLLCANPGSSIFDFWTWSR